MTIKRKILFAAITSSILFNSSAMAALYLGKVTNLSEKQPISLRSISIKTGDRQPPAQIPAGKSAFFSINNKQEFFTFVYGYPDQATDPTKVKGAASTCVVIMTGNGVYRVNATNPDKVECKILEGDVGGITITIKDKQSSDQDKPAK